MTDSVRRLETAIANRYRLEREIGQGGMATVYLAHDLKHDREVAIKVLRPEITAILGTERFLQEIRISARLDHPHILTLIDSGEADGLLYFVLPYVRGESLRQKLEREHQLPLDEALAITRDVASALDYAHAHGVVHRDIKPGNILLHEGEAVVADFGIALAVREAGGQRFTESGLSLGTPQYMSPEQATGDRPPDARSDIYSLAAVLYEMLAGEPPVTGSTVQAMIAKLLTERPTRLRTVRDTVPDAVDAAVDRALSKVPADRFPTAGAFVAALDAAATERPRGRRVRRWVLAAATAVVAAIAFAVAVRRTRAPITPPVSRVKLTFTGRATLPALSPDGADVAYFERRDCQDVASCPFDVVLQAAVPNGSRRVLTSVTSPGGLFWSPDGRRLLVLAVERSVIVSSLVSVPGGEVRTLGPGLAVWSASADTLLTWQPGPSGPASLGPRWIRRVLARDGTAVDSFAVTSSWAMVGLAASPNGRWFLIASMMSGYAPAKYAMAIVDRHGTVVADLGTGYADLDGWGQASDRIYLTAQHGDRFQVVRQRIDRNTGKLVGQPQPLEPTLSTDPIGVSVVAGNLAYAEAGPPRTTLWALQAGARARPAFRATRLYETTANKFHVDIAPDGSAVLLEMRIGAGDSAIAEGFRLPFSRGPLTRFGTPRLWTATTRALSPDWTQAVVAEHRGGRTIASVIDLATGTARVLGPAPSDSGMVWWLADGRFLWLAAARRELVTLDDRWRVQRRVQLPDSLGTVLPVPSPDGSELAALSARIIGDSVLLGLHRISPTDERIVPLVRTLPYRGGVAGWTWTSDGWIRLLVRNPAGGARLLRVSPRDGRLVDDGPAPVEGDEIRMWWARDGRRAVEAVTDRTSDIVLLRDLDPSARP